MESNQHFCSSAVKKLVDSSTGHVPCHKVGQGQPRIIICENLVGPKLPMQHTKSQSHWPFGSREEDIKRVLPYMGVVAFLVMCP